MKKPLNKHGQRFLPGMMGTRITPFQLKKKHLWRDVEVSSLEDKSSRQARGNAKRPGLKAAAHGQGELTLGETGNHAKANPNLRALEDQHVYVPPRFREMANRPAELLAERNRLQKEVRALEEELRVLGHDTEKKSEARTELSECLAELRIVKALMGPK